MSKNPYAEVIELLNSGNVDYRRIAIELAKTSPSTFLRLHNLGQPKPAVKELLSMQVIRSIRNDMFNNALVSAIKTLREATRNDPHGLGLKEARDVIFVAADREILTLSNDLMEYVKAIRRG